MAGVTHRVAEVLEILEKIPERHDRNTPEPMCKARIGSQDVEASRPLVHPENGSIVQGS